MQHGIFFKWVLFILLFTNSIFSQEAATTTSFSGAITATNNGISLLPTFSLGKPAAIFDFSIHASRWSFDPQLRFSLEAQPWSFIFWGRYKIVTHSRFKLSLGAHPAIAFKEETVLDQHGVVKNSLITNRYTATEIVPTLTLTKNASIGLYYLYSHGWDFGTTNNTHFITLNSTFSNIKVVPEIFLKWQPQIYYLKMDNKSGYYCSTTVSLYNKKTPFVLSSIVNQSIQTAIPGKAFIWNMSLTYNY